MGSLPQTCAKVQPAATTASAMAVMEMAPLLALLPAMADNRKPTNGSNTVARAVRSGYVSVGSVKGWSLIFQLMDIFRIDGFIMLIDVEDDCQCHSNARRRQYDGEERERLSAIPLSIIAPKCDEVEDGGVDHQLDAHQYHDG